MAHARITGIDTSAAKASPGVLAISTAVDLGSRRQALTTLARRRARLRRPAGPGRMLTASEDVMDRPGSRADR